MNVEIINLIVLEKIYFIKNALSVCWEIVSYTVHPKMPNQAFVTFLDKKDAEKAITLFHNWSDGNSSSIKQSLIVEFKKKN